MKIESMKLQLWNVLKTRERELQGTCEKLMISQPIFALLTFDHSSRSKSLTLLVLLPCSYYLYDVSASETNIVLIPFNIERKIYLNSSDNIWRFQIKNIFQYKIHTKNFIVLLLFPNSFSMHFKQYHLLEWKKKSVSQYEVFFFILWFKFLFNCD